MRKFAAGLALVVGTTFGAVGMAGAQTEQCPESPQECPPPEVGGEEVTPPEVGGEEVAQPRPSTQPQETLPVTGTDAAVLLGAGAVLVAGGGALVLRSKRATADTY